MAGCRRGLVVMPGMGHGQRLQDPADGLSGGGLQDQMEMVVHQAISVESKGIALLGLGQGLEELVEVGIVEEDAGAVVATVEGVINQAIRHQSRLSSHASSLTSSQSEGKSKNELTPIFLLYTWQVTPRFSPPGLPAYNGGCEASIGSLKRRTEGIAYRHDGLWTSPDVEAACQQANIIARPWGAHGPVREQLWNSCTLLTAAEREAFRTTVERLQTEERTTGGIPEEHDLDHYDQAAIDRETIRRALVAHGLLLLTRRRVPSPIKRPK